MFPSLQHLNEQQHRAATHEGASLRIIAGAGTGKTTTLTARVAWLVATGTPPERIMLLTFTRRAAREMVSRTRTMLGESAAATSRQAVLGGTFHAIAHRTLRRHAASLGLAEGFSVLDSSDAADIIDMVRDDQGAATTTDRRFPRKATLLNLYSRSVNTQRPLSEVTAELTPWCAERVEDIAAICRGYVARKRALALLDFDDLLLYWRAAATHPELGPILAGEIDHICVDEYQDVNALQVDVLRALRVGNERLTVVGDDSQAVYGFRGASPSHLLDIHDAFPDIDTIVLERNYRSTQQILDVANAIGEDAPGGFVTRLFNDAHGEPAEIIRCADEDAQVDAVCDRVLAHREAGMMLRDQAVLVRAAHHSDLLELELSRRRIPYVKYGGLRFLEAAHVKDLICLFRLADNPRDHVAWFRLLQLISGVGPASARRAIEALGLTQPGSPAEVLMRWPLALDTLPSAARGDADHLVEALVRAPDETITVHAERLAAAITPLIETAYDDAAARLADFNALVVGSRDATMLSDVAADLTLEPPSSTGDLAGAPLVDEDWLVISTVHSAKGLEWDATHVLHAADGNFPSDMALANPEGLEEERRLFYVAMTRPRRRLHIYVPLRFHHRPRGRDDDHLFGQPSRFLSERVLAVCTTSTRSHHLATFAEPLDATAEVELELEALWN